MLTNFTPVQNLIDAARLLQAGDPEGSTLLAAALRGIDASEAEAHAQAGAIAEAREMYVDSTCDIEIDDQPLVCEPGEDGVWVNAWLWVPADDDEDLEDDFDDEEGDDEDDDRD